MCLLIAMVVKAAIEINMTKPIQGASNPNLFTSFPCPAGL